MAISGFGAMFGGDTDVTSELLGQGMACVGWSEQNAPPLFDMLRSIGNGDLVFIKSFNPQVGLTIKALGSSLIAPSGSSRCKAIRATPLRYGGWGGETTGWVRSTTSIRSAP